MLPILNYLGNIHDISCLYYRSQPSERQCVNVNNMRLYQEYDYVSDILCT
eukprot:UN20876